jgi:putative chitinase
MMSIETVAAQMGAGPYALAIEQGCHRNGMTSEEEICQFLGTLAHESLNFTRTREMASGADYEGRKNLGNTQPGDGVRFKGRSLIQTTGRSNYAAYSQWKYGDDRCVKDPTMLERLPDCVDAAFFYWCVQNPVCRARAKVGDTLGVARAVNIGNWQSKRTPNGWEDRKAKTDKARALYARLRGS